MQSAKVTRLEISSGGFGLALAIHHPVRKPNTAIILCPGYLDSKDYPHLVALAEACAEAGLLAVRLDPVGTWDSEGSDADYSISRYLQNIASTDTYLRDKHGVTSIIIGGHSVGGFVSIVYAAQADVKAVVALCPPKIMLGTAVKTWEQDGVRHSARDLPNGSGERDYSIPWAFAEDSSRYSALEAVASYRATPLFLLACSDDDVIPPEEVKEIFEAAHEPKSYTVMPGMGHDYRKNPKHVHKVTDRAMDWLRSLKFTTD
jgi:pimeloyl-ACP methyl ester carboxylesterase